MLVNLFKVMTWNNFEWYVKIKRNMFIDGENDTLHLPKKVKKGEFLIFEN